MLQESATALGQREMTKPYLQRRGDTFSFRIAVPLDLRVLIGRRELLRTLRTPDRRVAAHRALLLASRALRLFGELRTMNHDSSDGLRVGYTLEIDLDELGLPKRIKVEGEPHEQDAVNAAIRTALEANPTRPILEVTPGQRKGEKSPSEGVKTLPIITLRAVIDSFLDKYGKRNKPAMLKKHRPVLAMMLIVVGDKRITDLLQADINAFFELLDKLPPRWSDACRKNGVTVQQLADFEHEKTIGPKTFDDTYLASIRSFLKAAKKDWGDQGFPSGLTTEGVEYIGDREEGEKKQRAFNPAELKKLFEGAEMRTFAADPTLAHCYWMPLIGLYTGARVNEICQLNPQTDIFDDPDTGVTCFSISKDTEADSRIMKTVKTGDSRIVPIHKKLIELGFLEYVKKMKAAGSMLIFPAWEPVNRRASGNAEKWFRQFLRNSGLRDETPKAMILGMHAFRHTLLTYGAMQKPPLSLFCITGHAQEEAPIHATGAGKGYLTLSLVSPLSERAALLDQLDYGLIFATPALPC